MEEFKPWKLTRKEKKKIRKKIRYGVLMGCYCSDCDDPLEHYEDFRIIEIYVEKCIKRRIQGQRQLTKAAR